MVYSCFRDNIIKYKWLIVLLASYLAILIYCSPLDITQLAAGDKCFAHIYSAVTGERLYNAPLYTLMGWIVTRLPIQDGFSLSLFLSIIPAVGCVALTYFAIKKQTDTKGAPFFGALVLASSFVFASQAVKVEVYVLAAFFLILGYVLLLYKKPVMAAVIFGLALNSHWIGAVPAVFALFIYNKEFRKKSYWCLISAAIVYAIWMTLPIYNRGIVSNNAIYSFGILFGWWGSGNISDLFDNLSRIPIVVFMIGFGWIPASLYFVNDFRKALPVIFTVSIFVLFLFVAPGDAAYQQMGTIIPLLAVASGLGFKYIVNINFKRIVVYGSLITLLFIPIVWNIDTSPTTARDMINQLDSIPDNSVVVCHRQNNDTYDTSVSWMVDYYNVTNNKHLYPLILNFLWDKRFVTGQETLPNGIIIPNTDLFNKFVVEDYQGIMDDLVLCNPEIDFYYYTLVDDRSMKCELRKWQ